MRYLLLSLMIYFFIPVQAQEKLYQLENNPYLVHKTRVMPMAKQAAVTGQIIKYTDTLSLPFIDDFSMNFLPPLYYLSPDSLRDTLLNRIYVDGVATDNISFMTEKSWNYNFNTSTNAVDSTAKDSMGIIIYGDIYDDITATSIFTAWPTYYTYNFDSTTGAKIDSTLVEPDSTIVFLVHIADNIEGTYYLDNHAFVNSSLPVLPPTVGVATLDGLNRFGQPHGTDGVIYGAADTLTSKPINLGGLQPADAVVMSFYWQPMGIGDFPNLQDSLVLEFRQQNGNWQRVWGRGGYTNLNTTPTFTYEAVAIDQQNFMHNAFQFRFRNYASISGNADHWHLDYIWIEANRTLADSSISDVAYVQPPTKLLKNYTSMPWNQFLDYQAQELNPEFFITLRNLSSTAQVTTFQNEVYEKTGNVSLHTGTPFTINFDPGAIRTETASTAPFTPFSGLPQDSFILTLRSTVNIAADVNRNNDTVELDHNFFNYYAYDDGTAERAYGVEGLGLKKVAYRFTLNEPDTLRAVRIHFTQIDHDASSQLFSVYVWKEIDLNNTGSGDDSLVFLDLQKPFYPEIRDGFVNYVLPEPLVVSGTFYVGWQQTDQQNVQVGYDMNNNAQAHTFFYAAGSWQQTTFTGAMMIRPVVGKYVELFHASTPKPQEAMQQIKVYPNPTRDWLNLELPSSTRFNLQVYDRIGKLVISRQLINENQINTSDLLPGMYFLRITDLDRNKAYSVQFMKAE